jgi:hypothetical protein
MVFSAHPIPLILTMNEWPFLAPRATPQSITSMAGI